MEYTISIIIPVYNAEQYLEECLKSVINQTIFEQIEVIAVNDGSTDSSRKILNTYAQKYSNIHVYSQTNRGIALTRQVGFNLSSGKYIAMLDNDDFVEPVMYERLLQMAEACDADYVYCNYSFYPKKVATKSKWFKKYEGTVDWNLIERNTQPWNKLIRRDLAESISMNELLPIYSDSVYVDLLIHAKNIVCVDEELYHYRVGHLSVSGSYIGKLDYYQEVSERAYLQNNFLDKDDLKRRLGEYFEYRYIYTLIQVCCVAAVNKNKVVYRDAVKKLHVHKYKKNKYTKIVLMKDYGKIKAFVLKDIIPSNYYLAKIICNKVFK